MNGDKGFERLANIPMSDEVKNEWVNDPLDKTLDKWLSSGPSEMRLINLEDKHMRILKGYSKEERAELEEAKDNGFLSAITLIRSIGNDDCYCHALTKKYCCEDINDNNQMVKDIVDFYTDKAKFPEQKYYVKLIKDHAGSYLNRDMLRNFCITGGCQPDSQFQTEFTEQEIKDIDPRYMAFAVPVEDDNE